MIKQAFLKRSLVPIALVALLTGLYVWAPFWISTLLNHQANWWRVPAIGGTMFDSSMYLAWVGYIQAGIPFANNIGWYKHVLSFLHALTRGGASIAELWLLSSWISSFLSALVVYMTNKRVMKLEAKTAGLFTLAWWLSVSAHSGWRPGVYSWYLAVGFLAFSLIPHHSVTTRIRRYLTLITAFLLSSIYPWFLIPTALWVSIEALYLHLDNRRILTGLWTTSALGSIAGILLALHYWPTQVFKNLEIFTRYGLGFTHLPFVTTSLATVLGWIIILALCNHSSQKNERLDRSLLTGWLVAFFCLELSPFTGIVFQNDHFRAIILLLSWLSLSRVISAFGSLEFSRRAKQAIFCVGALSATFVIWKASRLIKYYHDDLSIIQVAYWLPLLGASIYLLLPKIRQNFATLFLLASAPFALFAAHQVIMREIAHPKRLREQALLRDEIVQKVEPNTRICTDPEQADRIAASIPRFIIPGITYRFLPESENTQLQFLRAYVQGWRGKNEAERQSHLERLIAQDQYLPCNPFTEKILTKLEFTPSQIDTLTGCPRNHLKTALQYVTAGFADPAEGMRAFKEACPRVLILPHQENRWNIPTDAKTHSLSNGSLLVELSQKSQNPSP